MRTTVTLDDDVAAKLKTEARRTGKPFKVTLNEALRRGLLARKRPAPRALFRVHARDLGDTRPGINLDDIAGLLERIEGESHR